jgi:predicted alpha-1,2-mannosidase
MRNLIAVVLFLHIQAEGLGQTLTRWVDPFLGTGGHGHVYPGATTPFGMVQLSPDNGTNGWDWCGGYHYSSDSIAGFSHTHLSGTGIGDWCDVSMLPMTDTTGFRSDYVKIPFSHKDEKASPGFYSVKLGNGVSCALTATARNGYHQYQFPEGKGWLRVDMGFAINWDAPTDGMLWKVNDTTLMGYRASTGWAKGQKVFFTARFSSKIVSADFYDGVATRKAFVGPKVKAMLRFETGGEPLRVRVGLSSTSELDAMLALSETSGRTFEQVAAQAESQWEKELGKIRVESADPAMMTRFYTALYRSFLAPNLYSNADNRYRTHDNKMRVHNGPKYTIFSNWDIFRALAPLFTIVQPDRVPAFVNSMLSFYDDNGLLPVWDISTWEANTMTGYHAVPIIADAILKNVKGFDYQKAFEAMKKSAFQDQRGTQEYIRFGYLPQDKHGWSVTYTLEYAFDDWCIAQVAKKLKKMDDYELFMKRAMSYKNLFDPKTGFMRAKDSLGKFIEPFDPLLSEHGFEGQYIEGTAWQHSFFVPHDVSGFAELYGGKKQLAEKIDALFASPSVLHGENASVDVSGLIGQYAHGNEPSHHIIYMYTALGYPEKAAEKVRLVADSLYKNGPDGLSGNDDCGQMSAWFVFSALGFYPMNPASGEYMFGLPLVDNAEIRLPGGRSFRVETRSVGGRRSRIVRAEWNGKEIPVISLQHEQLLKGGRLVLELD